MAVWAQSGQGRRPQLLQRSRSPFFDADPCPRKFYIDPLTESGIQHQAQSQACSQPHMSPNQLSNQMGVSLNLEPSFRLPLKGGFKGRPKQPPPFSGSPKKTHTHTPFLTTPSPRCAGWKPRSFSLASTSSHREFQL